MVFIGEIAVLLLNKHFQWFQIGDRNSFSWNLWARLWDLQTLLLYLFQVINASDEDNLGYLTYDIIGGDTDCHDIFKIDKSTGALSINNTGHCLDYDVSPVHTLLVQAKDGE